MSLVATLNPGGAQAEGSWHLAVAWAAMKSDGRLHVAQWRAVEAVQALFALPGPDPEMIRGDLQAVAERVAQVELSDDARRRLFATACWVVVVDGRTHGRELLLLCELRRALGRTPWEARRILRLARAHLARSGPEGGTRVLQALHTDLLRVAREGRPN